MPLPEPDASRNLVISTGKSRSRELFTNPLYRSRTVLLMVVWVLGYAGLIYGAGAFAAVYMVDHGATPHFVFFTIAAGYAAVFLGFLANARLGERFERRDVIFLMGVVGAAGWVVAWVIPDLSVIAVAYVVGRVGTLLYLFNLYNYTAISYPTRIRARAFAWTDGFGHLGAWAGVTLLGPLYATEPNHIGWILWIVVPGALLPAALIRFWGIRQSGAVLEQVST
jgi:MFS family permease